MSLSRHGRRWSILSILCILSILPACLSLGLREYNLTGTASNLSLGGNPRVGDVKIMGNDVRQGEYVPPSSMWSAAPSVQNAESYSHYQDNGFVAVAQQPLSTFSTDVDTASYSNVRRFLNDGKLPPKDAVRIHELINYFDYQYPEPTAGHPVGLSVDAGPCPWNDQHRLVRIMLKAQQYTKQNMPARNFVFLVDTSGSMQPQDRLPLVQSSLRLLVEQLRPEDRVSVVSYAGDTSLRLPSTPGSEKRKILQVIAELTSGGGTNGAGGIEMAYEQARAGFIKNGVNRVILCTDGDFNVGITSEGDLTKFIEKKRDQGIFLTILGYGMGNLKDSTMQTLAHHGDGHYAYVDSMEEARKLFVEQGGALACVAKDVKLQVEFNPAKVSAYRLIGFENRLMKNEDFKNDKKDAGDMGSGHTVTALYEVVESGKPMPKMGVDALKYQQPPAGGWTATEGGWLTVKLRYKQPAGGASKELVQELEGPRFPSKVPYWGDDARWAATVAAFGMLLRDSEHKGTATFKSVLAMAEDGVKAKKDDRREEFVKLVKAAMKLK